MYIVVLQTATPAEASWFSRIDSTIETEEIAEFFAKRSKNNEKRIRRVRNNLLK